MSAAVAIFRSSVSGWSPIRPIASETSDSASRTFSETPSSETSDRARGSVESGTPCSMQSGPYDAGEAVGQLGRLDRWRRHFSSDASEPSLWRGLGLGLLATGAGLGIAELVVGLVEGTSSPVVPVGQEFIDYTPKWLKDWAIEQFGTNDKAVLVAGALIVILFLGGIIGVLAERGAKGLAYGLTVAVGVIGAWAVRHPTGADVRQAAADDGRHRRLARRAVVAGAPNGTR